MSLREGYPVSFTTPSVELDEAPLVINVKEFLRQGLGFGDGNISVTKRLENGSLTDAELNFAQAQICNHIVRVEKEDCGCGDGRTRDDLEQIIPRAKVFGGSVTMSVAVFNALGKTEKEDDSYGFNQAIEHLKSAGVKYGGHTANNHGQEKDSGCGAIDRYPEIIGNIQYYQFPIKQSLEAILGDGFDDEIYTKVMTNFRTAFESIDYSNFKGRVANKTIEESGAINTNLLGEHNEAFIVINKIRGTTLDQARFNAETGSKIQAFCVDEWRLQDIASTFLESADVSVDTQAYYGMLIYTLATSSVLTDGSQRVVVVE